MSFLGGKDILNCGFQKNICVIKTHTMPAAKRDLEHAKALAEDTVKRLRNSDTVKEIMKDAQFQFNYMYPLVLNCPQQVFGPLKASVEPIQPETLQKRATFINKEIKKNFPEMDFPKIGLPDSVQNQRKQTTLDNKTLEIDNPAALDADGVISLATRELKRALKDKIAPEVNFWLNLLIPFRGNDANVKHQRDNGDRCSAENLVYLDQFPGTIAVLCPSKAKVGNEPRPFCTVTIANPEDYDLIKQALTFLLSDDAKRYCYSSIKNYTNRVACGNSTGQWSSGRIRQRMIENAKLNDLINWHGQKQKIDANFTRAFVACCIHKERILFDRCLNVGDSAAEKSLGHTDGSPTNRAYMRFSVRPTQIQGKILKKVTAPIIVNNNVSVEHGIYIAAK